jgi:hypothetical protein
LIAAKVERWNIESSEEPIAVLIWMRYSAIGFKAKGREGRRQKVEMGVFQKE